MALNCYLVFYVFMECIVSVVPEGISLTIFLERNIYSALSSFLQAVLISSASRTPLLSAEPAWPGHCEQLYSFSCHFLHRYFIFHAISALFVVSAHLVLITRRHRLSMFWGILAALPSDSCFEFMQPCFRVSVFNEWTLLCWVENIPGDVCV